MLSISKFLTIVLLFSFKSSSAATFPNKISYLYGKPSLGSPLLTVKIGKEYKSLLMDTGASGLEIALEQKDLEKNAVKTPMTTRSKNLEGKIIRSHLWKLSNLDIANVAITGVLAETFSPNPLNIGKEHEKASLVNGAVGIKIFKNKRVILNFKNHKIEFVNEAYTKKIKNRWFLFDNNFKFQISINNAYFSAIIDTGSNISFADSKNEYFRKLKSDQLYQNLSGQKLSFFEPVSYDSPFKPKDEDWRIFLYDLSEANVDLIIGMDALLGKKLLIDMVDYKFCFL